MLDGVVSRQIAGRSEWLGWRQANVNASEAACLWSDAAHPHLTAYKLWAMRSGKLADEADNRAMKRGRLLEDDALEILSEERPGWQMWQPNVYLHHPEWRIGATPDAYAERNATNEELAEGRGHRRFGNIQIKTVGLWAFRKHWIDPDTGQVEVPLWIAVQASIEALLTGADWTTVAALVVSDGGTLELNVIDVELKPALIAALRPKVNDFWRRVRDGDPYPIDFGRDVDSVFEVYRDEDGSQIDLTGDEDVERFLEERAALKALEKEGENARVRRRALDAKLMTRMGNAKKALMGDRYIVAARIHKNAYNVPAQDYRFVRVNDRRLK
jgi:hypothetical protein